jgi:hypothetical protein
MPDTNRNPKLDPHPRSNVEKRPRTGFQPTNRDGHTGILSVGRTAAALTKAQACKLIDELKVRLGR